MVVFAKSGQNRSLISSRSISEIGEFLQPMDSGLLIPDLFQRNVASLHSRSQELDESLTAAHSVSAEPTDYSLIEQDVIGRAQSIAVGQIERRASQLTCLDRQPRTRVLTACVRKSQHLRTLSKGSQQLNHGGRCPADATCIPFQIDAPDGFRISQIRSRGHCSRKHILKLACNIGGDRSKRCQCLFASTKKHA